ncbi:hypothetical protein LCGC14_0723300 [marine sediment metagenome]|uniref:Uncharacterized protein n=1 Tax=marine sediment metagenome TaxID=412755 RepID=A0A0F9QG03_9ZZZZ
MSTREMACSVFVALLAVLAIVFVLEAVTR